MNAQGFALQDKVFASQLGDRVQIGLITRRALPEYHSQLVTGAPSQPSTPLQGAPILVGVTGGIAAYKTCFLVSRLTQSGAVVTVAMTGDATKFVTPLTFQALSGRPVYTSAWDHIESSDPQHISLARSCRAAIVAPCTMNCMAKLAMGLTDDVVTLILSAIDRSKTPVLLAPAMNAQMWGQPSTQRNLMTLQEDGYRIVGPGEGWQACRTSGPGRMSEPEDLFDAIVSVLSPV
jgi:phosphopantothenoylcysteine decarboxylase/phosphopantothenate--cysteine ligase